MGIVGRWIDGLTDEQRDAIIEHPDPTYHGSRWHNGDCEWLAPTPCLGICGSPPRRRCGRRYPAGITWCAVCRPHLSLHPRTHVAPREATCSEGQPGRAGRDFGGVAMSLRTVAFWSHLPGSEIRRTEHGKVETIHEWGNCYKVAELEGRSPTKWLTVRFKVDERDVANVLRQLSEEYDAPIHGEPATRLTS